jgi:hypothetical protein
MPSYTLADLEQRVYSRLENNSVFYPQAEVDAAVNECLRVLNLHTGFLQNSVVITSEAGRVFYDIPYPMLFPIAVTLAGRQLKRSSLPSMALKFRDWTRHASSTFGPVADWMPLGIRKLAIHPADSTGGRELKIYGVIEPTVLVGATDAIILQDEYVDILEEYAAHIIQLKEGGKIFSDASLLFLRFQEKMREYARWRNYVQPRYFVEVESVKIAGG